MAHNRKYVPDGVALVEGSLSNDSKMQDQDKVEQLLIDSNFFEHAPFKWICFTYRYGSKNTLKPEYHRISKKYNDLTVAIELDMEILE